MSPDENLLPEGIFDLATEPSEQRQKLEDAFIVERIAEDALIGRYRWASGLGWLKYTGAVWKGVPEPDVVEQVRKAVIAFQAAMAESVDDVDYLKRIPALFSRARLDNIVKLARGIEGVLTDTGQLDQHPDLLVAANGVVDLRTGKLSPHDPNLLATTYTPYDYDPDARHSDWDHALQALPPEVGDWMQVRFGQAATGHPTPDDILPVLQGSGANGKSTIVSALMRALGGYAVPVPERVLLANPSDHPTELMTLRGARLAVIEETPEARHFSVKRLKDVLGTDPMTARYIAKDSVSWHPTHSIFLTSNYMPRVDETDHGTWRRLALVRFPFTFGGGGRSPAGSERRGDPNLRDRLKNAVDGQLEAVLAWLVAGARRWYESDKVIAEAPEQVIRDTSSWREDSDTLLRFVSEELVLEPGCYVPAEELYSFFRDWTERIGQVPWSQQTFSARLSQHDALANRVERRKTSLSQPGLHGPRGALSPAAGRKWAWHGVRYRGLEDNDGQVVFVDKRLPDSSRAGVGR